MTARRRRQGRLRKRRRRTAPHRRNAAPPRWAVTQVAQFCFIGVLISNHYLH